MSCDFCLQNQSRRFSTSSVTLLPNRPFFVMAFLAATSVGLISCTTPRRAVSYTDRFDAWRGCVGAEADALKGDQDALRTCFLAAYVRVSEPYLGGEDLEGMTSTFRRLLTALGDDGFSGALATQRPEVVSAAGCFFQPSSLDAYPRTAALFRDAPKIDWPLSKAIRAN